MAALTKIGELKNLNFTEERSFLKDCAYFAPTAVKTMCAGHNVQFQIHIIASLKTTSTLKSTPFRVNLTFISTSSQIIQQSGQIRKSVYYNFYSLVVFPDI